MTIVHNKSILLEPFFQPIINVKSGLIAYNEVLARRKNNQGEYLSAGAIFSSSKLSLDKILSLDNQVRRKAFEKFKNHQGEAKLSVNISPAWFTQHAEQLKLKNYEIPTLTMLNDCGIDPSRIIIELTEYDGDIKLIRHFVDSYRDMGIKVAIDDFGTGFSQIDRLMEIEPDIIKLDMKLFQRTLVSDYARDLVEAFASFTKKRGIELIFEGVETEQQYHVAVSSGAEFIQGYLFSQAQAQFYNDNHFVNHIKRLNNTFLEHKIAI